MVRQAEPIHDTNLGRNVAPARSTNQCNQGEHHEK